MAKQDTSDKIVFYYVYKHDADTTPYCFLYRHNAERYVAQFGGRIQEYHHYLFDHVFNDDLSLWEQALDDIDSGQLPLW